MKYCRGNCRKQYIETEGSAISCPYHRAYTVDKNKGEIKPYEICMKKGILESLIIWFWKTFFPDLVDINNLSNGSRKSKIVLQNRENLLDDIGDRDNLL